jgi:hypothetical protein
MHNHLNNHYRTLFEKDPTDVKSFIDRPDAVKVIESGKVVSKTNPVVVLTSTDIIQLTGSFGWRFFQWGLIKGSVLTPWSLFIVRHVDQPRDWLPLARATDMTNPTPFMVFLFLTLFSIITLVRTTGTSPTKAVDQTNAHTDKDKNQPDE